MAEEDPHGAALFLLFLLLYIEKPTLWPIIIISCSAEILMAKKKKKCAEDIISV